MSKVVPVLLATWLGAACFFSFVVAPAAFKAFPRPDAGRYLGTIFPIYYIVGLVCSAAAAAILAQELKTPPPAPRFMLRLGLICVIFLCMTFSMSFLKQIHAMREMLATARTPELEAKFGRAHGISMSLNLVAILSALAALVLELI
jgi:hypothetical protein